MIKAQNENKQKNRTNFRVTGDKNISQACLETLSTLSLQKLSHEIIVKNETFEYIIIVKIRKAT